LSLHHIQCTLGRPCAYTAYLVHNTFVPTTSTHNTSIIDIYLTFYSNMEYLLLPFWISFFFITSHCFGFTYGEKDVEGDLETAKAKWDGIVESLDVPLDYSYGYSTDIQGNNVIVTVEDDNVTSVRSYWFGNDDMVDDVGSTYFTVEGLFDLIENSIADPKVIDMVVEYDTALGYPSDITITHSETVGNNTTSHRIEPMTFYTLIQRDLDTYRQLWDESLMVDYDYTSQVSCFCLPSFTTPKRVEVRAGEIVSTTDTETNEFSEEFVSLIEAFDNVQVAIDNRYHRIDITFDRTLGYPSSYSYDIDPGMADEEQSVEIFDVINMGVVMDPPLSQVAAEGGQDLIIEESEESSSTLSPTTKSPIATPVTIPQDTTTTIAIKNGIESVAVMSHGNYGQIQTLSYLICSLFGIIIIQS
jgi:hypothetical protein